MSVTIFQMAEKISEVFGVYPGTGREHAIKLRNEGLLTSTGRGRGAAKMHSGDAANFTLSLAASNNTVESPDCTRNSINCPHNISSNNSRPNLPSVPFPFLYNDEGRYLRFGETLERLIEFCQLDKKLTDEKGNEIAGLWIDVIRPGHSITLDINDGAERWTIEYKNWDGESPRRVTFTIDLEDIKKIGRIIRD